MKIVFIGAGNLATHLSLALQKAGFEIVQVYSRTEESAKELAGLLQVPYTTNINNVVHHASIYFISVCDDAIAPLSEKLVSSSGIIVHTAGSVPMDVFENKFDNYGVFYPLQTFSKRQQVDFSNIPIFVEANTQNNLNILQKIACSISQNVFEAGSQQRKQLHLAAVFCCNFVNHLYHLASEIAGQAGFNFNILSALILATAQKAVLSGNPKEVQTGPAVRNDRKVMEKHLDLLNAHPEWQEIYSILSKGIVHELHELTRKKN